MNKSKSKVSEKIELMLFDILYLVMNCDFEVSEEEEDFFEDAMKDLDDESKEIIQKKKIRLEGIVSKGFDAIKDETLSLVQIFADLPEDMFGDLKKSYLNLIKEIILSDKKIHENERVLYREIARVWKLDFLNF